MTPDLLQDPDLAGAAGVIAGLRRGSALVHCITATVSMNIVADGLLAAGARPMMTETLQEAPVITPVADALVVNFGTLSTDAMDAIPATVQACRVAGHPWVLDPTAIGVAPVRTAMARELLASRPAVVRGNASEILALTGSRGGRGADSLASADQAREAAVRVAERTGGAVAVSGPSDLVLGLQPRQLRRGARGTALLTRVTGTGCLLGALVAACVTVSRPFEAAVAATIWMNLAGELAAARTTGPGSFRVALLDALDEVGQAAAYR